MRRLILPFLLTCLLVSCSVTERLSLSESGEQKSTASVEVSDFFIDVAADFDEFNDPANPRISFQKLMEEIRDSLQYSGSTYDVTLNENDGHHDTLGFSFPDIQSLFEAFGGEAQDILLVDDKTLVMHLGMDNWEQMEKIVPLLADDHFQPFGPRYNQGMSAEEYGEMLDFMLGDGASDDLQKSTVSLTIHTPADITWCRNMTQKTGTEATLTFPLVDLLLLAEPIEAELSWR